MIIIGVDVWKTLLFSTQNYSKKRWVILLDFYNKYKIKQSNIGGFQTESFINAALDDSIECAFDTYELETGFTVPTNLKWFSLENALRKEIKLGRLMINEEDIFLHLEEIKKTMMDCFEAEVNVELCKTLNNLANIKNVHVVVISNTGKIPSTKLREYLKPHLDFAQLIGSDEVGFTKPTMLDHIRFKPDIMIGDDPRTDGKMSDRFLQIDKTTRMFSTSLLTKYLSECLFKD